jgi:hypothetical protein
MNKFDVRDLSLRVLIVAAGSIAGLLLALKGQARALPALAIGGTLGAVVMRRYGATEE